VTSLGTSPSAIVTEHINGFDFTSHQSPNVCSRTGPTHRKELPSLCQTQGAAPYCGLPGAAHALLVAAIA